MKARTKTVAWVEVLHGAELIRFHGSDALGLPFDVRLTADEAASLIFRLHSAVLFAKQHPQATRAGRGKAA